MSNFTLSDPLRTHVTRGKPSDYQSVAGFVPKIQPDYPLDILRG